MKHFKCFVTETLRHSEFKSRYTMAVILGLNAYHGDSSAAIVVDGKLIAAVEEERFRHQALGGFPVTDRVLLEGSGMFSDVSKEGSIVTRVHIWDKRQRLLPTATRP